MISNRRLFSRSVSHEPVQAQPLEVVPRPGETPDRMIRRFVKKVKAEGIMDELYFRRSFEKPSAKRRRKRAAALARARREQAEKKE